MFHTRRHFSGWLPVALAAVLAVGAFRSLAAAGELFCDCECQKADFDDSACPSCLERPFADRLTLFAGIEGSKQPQDFGVNANLGGRAQLQYAAPLFPEHGIGLQIGTALTASANAVRVAELLGEEGDRVQSFNSVGLFQRSESGVRLGFAVDVLYQDSFDRLLLAQTRLRAGYRAGGCDEFGVTAHLPIRKDTGLYGAIPVTLDPIAQGSLYWRRFWPSGTQTSFWVGVGEGHSEENAVTGTSPSQDEVFLFGADILAPLNDFLAIYGETNLMMPADTGTVDAFLGIEFFPRGDAYEARQQRYSPLLPVASSTSFSVDLSRR